MYGWLNLLQNNVSAFLHGLFSLFESRWNFHYIIFIFSDFWLYRYAWALVIQHNLWMKRINKLWKSFVAFLLAISIYVMFAAIPCNSMWQLKHVYMHIMLFAMSVLLRAIVIRHHVCLLVQGTKRILTGSTAVWSRLPNNTARSAGICWSWWGYPM